MNRKSLFATRRLTLLEYSFDLSDQIKTVYSDEEIVKYTLQGRQRNAEELNNITSRIISNYNLKDKNQGKWLIELNETRDIIGYAGLIPLPKPETGTEITYAIIKEFRKNGYATEISKALLEYSFTILKLRELFALIEYGNSSSEAVVKRLKMKYLRDVLHVNYKFKLYGISNNKVNVQH